MVSKSDLIDKFITVTGTDKDTASHMLEACSNNLESAVATFLDGGTPATPINGSSSTGNIDTVRAPIPQTQGVLVDDFRPTVWRNRQTRSVFDGFGGVVTENGKTKTNNAKKLKKLEELFRPPMDMMHKGTFQSARDAAMKENKWLMVNIQNVSEFACQTLNRDIWKCEKVKSLVKENFLFWQESSENSEAEWYMTFYTVDQWPHVCVIDPRTGGRLLTFSNITKDTIITSINNFLADHGSRLDTHPSDNNNGVDSKKDVFRMNEDEQLAAAIAASLNETRYDAQSPPAAVSNPELAPTDDDEPSPPKDLNQDRKSDSATSPVDGENEATPKKKLLRKIFPRRRKRSQPDSDPFCLSSPLKSQKESCDNDDEFYLASETLSCDAATDRRSDKGDCAMHLLLKHPDGKREELRFDTNCKVKDLTAIISRKYDLTTHELIKNFPRKIISSLPGSMLLENAGVFDKDTVFVQEKL